MTEDRAMLVDLYGADRVEWAESFVADYQDDMRDERDRHYP